MASIIDTLIDTLKTQVTRGNSQVRLESTVLNDLLTDFAPVTTQLPKPVPPVISLPEPSPVLTNESVVPSPEPATVPVLQETKGISLAKETVLPVENLSAAPAPVSPKMPDIKVDHFSLAELRSQGNTCSACKLDVGEMRSQDTALNEQARLMIITEPSGKNAAQLADPFAGEAGELLCKMIRGMKINLDDIYLCMAHRCYGPGAREHIAESKPYLERQIELIKPEVILIFGGAALNILLGEQVLQSNRGRWLTVKGIPTMATYPPAYLMRRDEGKRSAWNDMKQVMSRL